MDNNNSNDNLDNSKEIVDEEVKIEENIEKNDTTESTDKNVNIAVSKEKRMGFKIKNPKVKKIVIITCSVIFALIILFAIFICFNKVNSKVYKNLYVLNQNVSGYTTDDLKIFLEEKNNIKHENKTSVIQDTDEIYSFIQDDINLKIDVASTINSVMEYGRSGNIIIDNIDVLKALFKRQNIEVKYAYDNNKLDEVIKNIDLSIKDRTVDTKYNIDEENKKLVITVGKSGNGIDTEKEKEKILNKIQSSYETIENEKIDNNLVLDIVNKKPDSLNPEEVYNKVKREPKDAYVDKTSNPTKLVSEVVGLDLDLQELKDVLNKKENKTEGKVIEISLKVIEPKVKLENLSNELFSEKIAGYTTYFNAGQYARANNLKVALAAMNGKIVMPGEIYSYNDNIGDTTAERGYMAAATFKGGTTVDEMGGGICQTVSTLYNVVLMANMEIVERHAHGLPVGYVQPSRDATVYSPYLDFKFKNTRTNPIKIVTSFSGEGNMNISIYGIKEKEEYDVEIISQYLSTIPFTTRYIYDPNMQEGSQVVVSNGVNGYSSQSFIKKSLNGVQVSYDLLSRDTYNAQQQVIRVGTRKGNTGS